MEIGQQADMHLLALVGRFVDLHAELKGEGVHWHLPCLLGVQAPERRR